MEKQKEKEVQKFLYTVSDNFIYVVATCFKDLRSAFIEAQEEKGEKEIRDALREVENKEKVRISSSIDRQIKNLESFKRAILSGDCDNLSLKKERKAVRKK